MVNATTVDNPFSKPNNPFNTQNNFSGQPIPFSDGTLQPQFTPGLFGEAAIDLTKALPASANGTFNWVYMSTRSSSSPTSSLKDIVQPYSVVIPLVSDIRGTVFNDLNANRRGSPSGW